MIPGLSTDEERDLILSVGTHRPGRMLTPVEVAELLQRALDAGASSESIAKRCLLEGTTTISRFLRLLDLEEASKHLVVFGSKKGSLGFTTAMEVAASSSSRVRSSCSIRTSVTLKRPAVQAGFGSKVHFSCAKACRLLGYEPEVGFAEGMKLTEAWARAAGLLP